MPEEKPTSEDENEQPTPKTETLEERAKRFAGDASKVTTPDWSPEGVLILPL